MKKVFKNLLTPLMLTITVLSFLVFYFFGPINLLDEGQIKVFVIPQNLSDFSLSDSLYSQGIIRNKKGFDFLSQGKILKTNIKPGGYKLSTSLNSWQVIDKLKQEEDLVWLNIYFCPRKEQVGERLATALKWDADKIDEWNNLDLGFEYSEGVFYPDTYLIPRDESPTDISKRFINNFEQKFDTLRQGYLNKNIKWTTGLKIASLIAREAAGRDDMHLISGIIWNRLNMDMRLQIDATMQYTHGKNENGEWWGPINLTQKLIDSPYNTYRRQGLPPTPICSPNIEYIEAALNPTETDCIYYLHDKNKKIYCSQTYEEHKDNINNYLR